MRRGSAYSEAATYWGGDVIAHGGDVVGGNDDLDGGDGLNTLYGDNKLAITDAYARAWNANLVMSLAESGDIVGGFDRLIGGSLGDLLVGDSLNAETYATAALASNNVGGTAIAKAGNIIGGVDDLNGGAGNDTLVGDYYRATSSVITEGGGTGTANQGDIVGGDDELRGGAGDDLLFGDNLQIRTTGRALDGDDILEGGAGADQMWGDTPLGYAPNGGGHFNEASELSQSGVDTFVFRAGEVGTDIIWDFQGLGAAEGDIIALAGYGPPAQGAWSLFSEDLGNPSGLPEHENVVESGVRLTLDGGQVIYFVGADAIPQNLDDFVFRSADWTY